MDDRPAIASVPRSRAWHNSKRRRDSGRYCGNGGRFPETKLTWSVGLEPRNVPGLTPWTCSKVHRVLRTREIPLVDRHVACGLLSGVG